MACEGADCSSQEDLLDSQAPAAAAYPSQPTAVEAATEAAEEPASAKAPVPRAEPEELRMRETQVHLRRGSLATNPRGSGNIGGLIYLKLHPDSTQLLSPLKQPCSRPRKLYSREVVALQTSQGISESVGVR